MTPTEAAATLATIEGLFPKWERTPEITNAWRRKIERCGYHRGQIEWAAQEHRMSSRFHDPAWPSIMEACKRCPEVNGQPRVNHDAVKRAEQTEFERRRAAAKAWIASASDADLAAVRERAARYWDHHGSPEYADRIRHGEEADPDVLGGSVIAAIEGQLERDGRIGPHGPETGTAHQRPENAA